MIHGVDQKGRHRYESHIARLFMSCEALSRRRPIDKGTAL